MPKPKYRPPSDPFHFRLPREEANHLRRIARAEGRTISGLARHALRVAGYLPPLPPIDDAPDAE